MAMEVRLERIDRGYDVDEWALNPLLTARNFLTIAVDL
jgi:hypothetical protein